MLQPATALSKVFRCQGLPYLLLSPQNLESLATVIHHAVLSFRARKQSDPSLFQRGINKVVKNKQSEVSDVY